MLEAGQTFAHYVIEAPIGEGGMGAVYRAYDSKLRRKVALKVMHPDLAVPDAAARLVREARAAAAFAHPNTIAIHDLGEIDGTVFLVMELVSGAPLRAYVGDAAVPVAQKLRWLVDIARGLGAAHKAGLVHRDVKPTNVMVSDDGVVKVLDFGLAKPLEAASFHTDVGLVVGTPRYMAPELFTGMRADARSDQYAFGVTAYELLAGVHPGGPIGAVPAALDTLVPEVGAAVARIIARTLSRGAGERFASMNEVASELEDEILTARASERREASPPTRREGVASPAAASPAAASPAGGSPADAALAHAPTELPASFVAPRAAPLAPRAASLVASLAADSAERSRRGRGLRVAAVLGVVAIAGYGAMRLLGEGHVPVILAPSPAVTNGGGLATDESSDASADAPTSTNAELGTADLLDASDLADASGTSDAGDDALPDADVVPDGATRVIHTDDFLDPWSKPASPTRVH